jgi:hypothetical protein
MNVVWILGAGFSRPLGGPLLFDFFSERQIQMLSMRHATQGSRTFGPELEQRLGDMYSPEQVKMGSMPWRNPEEFLEFLEAATDPDEAGTLAQTQLGIAGEDPADPMSTAREYHKAARQHVALVCDVFLDGKNPRGERWDPYLRWAKTLDPKNDTVVTFNYDRVPDLIAAELGGLKVRTPCPPGLYRTARRIKCSNPDCADVLKLHGSVDWRRVPPEQGHAAKPAFEKLDSVWDAVNVENDEPAIATPGRQKLGDTNGSFQELWELAEDRIAEADVVVFVGYRFPETDNEAKRRILNTLRDRRNENPLTVRIVLGPQPKDAPRLQGMLEWALSARHRLGGEDTSGRQEARIIVEPMGTEDFLAVFERERLTAFPGYR